MIAEQTTSSTFSPHLGQNAATIEMTVRMEVPIPEAYGPGPNVSIALVYEPKLPEELQDELHRGLYNGVHSGLARVGAPLPQGGVYVEIARLAVVQPQLKT